MKKEFKENSNLFDVTFTWTELCMASVTVKAENEEEAKAIVKQRMADYLDYCVNNGSTELVERYYESLKISSSKKSIGEFATEDKLKSLEF